MNREREMRPAVTDWLRSSGHTVVYETSCVSCGTFRDVVGARFGERTGRLIPNVDSCIAVELKLSDVAGVLHQAVRNRLAVQFSYAAMPAGFVTKMRPQTHLKFLNVGVGLLAVAGGMVVEVIKPKSSGLIITRRLRRQLWRRRFDVVEQVAT